MFSKVRFILRRNILGKNINQSYKFLIIGNNNNYLRDSVANNLTYLSQKNKKNYSLLLIVPCFITSLIVWNG